MGFSEEKLDEYRSFFEQLKENGKLTRLGKLFRTKENGYIYDMGTGKVLMCDENEFKVLESIFENDGIDSLDTLQMKETDILDSLCNIRSIVNNENILKAPPLTEFSSIHSDFDSLKDNIENRLEQITLELTEKCNLRCKYCIYSDNNSTHRDFDSNDMNWETAKEAIEYGMAHSGERLSIAFYGGEPLLKFDLLKQCVDFTKQIKGNKEIIHSMTTNMVLVTKEIAEYVASVDQFCVVCSLDGPKEIHDDNRLTVDGNGSFEKAIQGLKYLVDAYKDRASKYLSLSMVMTLPATPEKLQKIQSFFESLEWLPNDLVKNISYVSNSSHRSERLLKKSKELNKESVSEFTNPITDWTIANTIFNDKVDENKIFTSDFAQSSHLRIHKRMIVDEAVGCYNLNGCCIPASRRLYVTAKGDFSLCEKIGNAPYIGNIRDGVDLESVKKHYIDDYMNYAKELCSDCWAVRLCGLCYVDCYDEKGFRPEFKVDSCGSALFGAEQALINYHEILERHPERLEYLNNVVMG